jgi:hypothetical protein
MGYDLISDPTVREGVRQPPCSRFAASCHVFASAEAAEPAGEAAAVFSGLSVAVRL